MKKDLSNSRDFRNYSRAMIKKGNKTDLSTLDYIGKLLHDVYQLERKIDMLSGEDNNVESTDSGDAGSDSKE